MKTQTQKYSHSQMGWVQLKEDLCRWTMATSFNNVPGSPKETPTQTVPRQLWKNNAGRLQHLADNAQTFSHQNKCMFWPARTQLDFLCPGSNTHGTNVDQLNATKVVQVLATVCMQISGWSSASTKERTIGVLISKGDTTCFAQPPELG